MKWNNKRPIHCSDKKRLKFYVKDGEWKKDDGDKIDDAISQISSDADISDKRMGKTKSKLGKERTKTEEYLEIIKQVMGGTTDSEVKNIRKTL